MKKVAINNAQLNIDSKQNYVIYKNVANLYRNIFKLRNLLISFLVFIFATLVFSVILLFGDYVLCRWISALPMVLVPSAFLLVEIGFFILCVMISVCISTIFNRTKKLSLFTETKCFTNLLCPSLILLWCSFTFMLLGGILYLTYIFLNYNLIGTTGPKTIIQIKQASYAMLIIGIICSIAAVIVISINLFKVLSFVKKYEIKQEYNKLCYLYKENKHETNWWK